jgi:radical SAM superfamily enzyme YgiQ (UPF0313 family)
MTLKENLVISVPRLEIHRPPISTAIVCSVIKQAGHPVQALDLNIKYYNFLGSIDKFLDMDDVWAGERSMSAKEKNDINEFLLSYVEQIATYDRVFVSVFGFWCHQFTEMLLTVIRTHLPQIEIVLGGQGVLATTVGKSAKHFGEIMKSKKLCDTWLAGEGEKVIIDILNADVEDKPGLNNPNYKQLNDLDNLPFPDYGFYDLDEYDYLSEDKEVFIVGSRGCVRRCTYCDVARYWPKFRFRSGENLASEMINHYEQHGVKRFYFTDSLINGSIKAFHDMCEQLADYNASHNVGFKWGGQIIFRPPKQLPKDHYELVARAGGDLFLVGYETGSDKIRWEMDKKFSNDDTEWQLEEFSKHGLHAMFLMVTGYLTEQREDHEETLKIFDRWQRFVADGTITQIDLGSTLYFLADTPLARMIDSHEVYFLNVGADIEDKQNQNNRLWQTKLNPDLDVAERIRRQIEIHKTAIKYNWPVSRGVNRIRTLKLMTKLYYDFLKSTNNPKMIQDAETGLRWVT